jgi:RES domain
VTAAAPSIAYAPFTLAPGTALHRVQRSRPAPSTVTIGDVRLPPAGTLAGRFDLPSTHCAAFALRDLTAVYETQARRDALAISITTLGQRELLSVATIPSFQLADLRAHTSQWPLLIAARYAPTQALADDAASKRFEGVIYLSAQEHLGECVALFGAAIKGLSTIAKTPLSVGGRLHHLVAQALIGTMLPLVP